MKKLLLKCVKSNLLEDFEKSVNSFRDSHEVQNMQTHVIVEDDDLKFFAFLLYWE